MRHQRISFIRFTRKLNRWGLSKLLRFSPRQITNHIHWVLRERQRERERWKGERELNLMGDECIWIYISIKKSSWLLFSSTDTHTHMQYKHNSINKFLYWWRPLRANWFPETVTKPYCRATVTNYSHFEKIMRRKVNESNQLFRK